MRSIGSPGAWIHSVADTQPVWATTREAIPEPAAFTAERLSMLWNELSSHLDTVNVPFSWRSTVMSHSNYKMDVKQERVNRMRSV